VPGLLVERVGKHEPGDADLEIRVLGSLAALRSGVPIMLGSARQRAVLALLILHRKTGLRRDAIIDALWGDDPPLTAVVMVQSAISHLRHLLDPDWPSSARSGPLVSDGTSYLLRIADDRLDVAAFRRLAARAREARTAGESAAAWELYEEALGLWQGEPLDNVEVLRGHPAVIGLALDRTAVVVEYAEAASAAGRHDQLLPHLQALTNRDPLNERAQACLMIALAGSGQPSAALRLYQDVRVRLDDELGMVPGVDLVAAQARVLRQQVPSAVAAGPVTGGVETGVWAPVRHPADLADFVARAVERPRSTALGTMAVPVAVISELPGVGSTTLAVHVPRSLRCRLHDLLRDYGVERLAGEPCDEGDEALKRVLTGFLELDAATVRDADDPAAHDIAVGA
jgi:DNA-binding SARP family transcriptional activator